MIVDNFALTLFQTCPAKYLLRIKQGWVPIRKRAALGFGGAIHAGLAEWYRTGSQKQAIEKLVQIWPASMPVDDFRTREKAAQTLLDYFKEYPQENFKVINAPEDPLVEKAFTIDTEMFLECQPCAMYSGHDDWATGKCSNCGEPLEPILYGGVIDAGIEFAGKVYVLEHKTTTQMGSTYFLQFKPNNQVTGYIWALGQLSSSAVGGAMINGIGIYKASATKFERALTNRAPAEIEEWLLHVRETCNEIKRCERTGVWPWRTMACTLYGLCDYHNVHVLAHEKEREKRLEQDYVKSTWDHESRDD